MENTSLIVAENGTVVEPGGLYLTFSGDHENPYKLAKIISIGGGPGGASPYLQIKPDLTTVQELDLWIKLYYANFVERPLALTPEILNKEYRVIPISPSVFLGWGPPRFPVRLGSESVTAEELAQRVEDWYLRDSKGAITKGG